MKDNLKHAHELSDTAKMKEAMERLAGIDAGLKEWVDDLVAEAQSATDDADDARGDAETARGNADDAENALADAERRIEELEANDHITELAKIRTDLYNGKLVQGRERLERVLQDMDNCWRLRA